MTAARNRLATPKRKRLDLRITEEQKARLEHAAALRGQTLSGLIVHSALREAEQAIREHEIMTLTARDSLAFAQALLDPPPPTPRLLEAIADYKAEFGSRVL